MLLHVATLHDTRTTAQPSQMPDPHSQIPRIISHVSCVECHVSLDAAVRCLHVVQGHVPRVVSGQSRRPRRVSRVWCVRGGRRLGLRPAVPLRSGARLAPGPRCSAALLPATACGCAMGCASICTHLRPVLDRYLQAASPAEPRPRCSEHTAHWTLVTASTWLLGIIGNPTASSKW